MTHTFIVQVEDGGTEEAGTAVREKAQLIATAVLNKVETRLKALGIAYEDIEVRYLGSN